VLRGGVGPAAILSQPGNSGISPLVAIALPADRDPM
jgi:hypothetical protein